MVAENVTVGAGTCLYEGTRERKKSEMTEQELLQSQGREEAQEQRGRHQPLQPPQDGARPALRGPEAEEPAASTLIELSANIREAGGLWLLLPALFISLGLCQPKMLAPEKWKDVDPGVQLVASCEDQLPNWKREWLEWEDRRQAAAQLCRSQRCPPSSRTRLTRPRRSCRDPVVHNTLFSGDLQQIQALFQDEDTANMIVETVSNQLAWSAEQGFWVLTPKTKQTVPLTITAARGYTDCARHLIRQGAELDARVGGRAALHEACAQAQSDSVQLLLTFGAKANVLSEEGMTPLHLCTTPESLQCAKLLLEAGATVNLAAQDSEVTPLHVAAARGLEKHVALYLEHGANVGLRTSQGETALNSACAGAEGPGSGQQHQAAARRLLEAGADARAAGRKRHTPLHNACANGCGALAELLLRHGACAGVPNAAGHTPMDCALQAVQDAPNWEPEVLFTALLDYGAQPVRPEMLKHCANFPRALEVLLNAYPCVPSCDTWVDLVLPELWQEHEAFYSSALGMVNQPRRLQHLARLAVRAQLGSRCRQAAARLPLPPLLRDYLLLRVEGRIQ